MRLFAASLATETNTFSPIPTSRASFEATFYAPAGAHPPASEYLGRVSQWHLYMHVPAEALKRWPTVKEDVQKALAKSQSDEALEGLKVGMAATASEMRARPTTDEVAAQLADNAHHAAAARSVSGDGSAAAERP